MQNLTVENLAASECQDHVPALKRQSVWDAKGHITTPNIRRASKLEPRQSVQYRRMSQLSRSSVTGSSLGVNRHIGLFPMRLQNTYKLEPDVKDKFKPGAVRLVIKEVLEECLDGETYNPTQCRNLTLMLTDLIKCRVKELGYPRYKYVVTVTLGQDRKQGLQLVSRCLMNKDTDRFAEFFYANDVLFAVATCYAMYFE